MIADLFIHYRDDVQHVASLLLGLAMWRWGGGPERAITVVFLLTMILPILIVNTFGLGDIMFGRGSWVYIALDLLAGAGFLAIALNANRNYTLWIAGFQLVAMGAHAVRGLVDAVSPLAYGILAIGPSYCQLLLMLAGFLRHVARQRRYGRYRDWRLSQGLWATATLSSRQG